LAIAVCHQVFILQYCGVDAVVHLHKTNLVLNAKRSDKINTELLSSSPL